MDHPIRIQLSRANGWKMPPNTVKVARGTIWGNPFKIGEPSGHSFNDGGDPTPMIAALTREQAFAFYRDMISGFLSPEMHPVGHEWLAKFKNKMHGGHPSEMARSYLRGKNLACWCKVGSQYPCHAAVLLELANAPT